MSRPLIDTTTVRRNIEQVTFSGPQVDVQIDVEWNDDEVARELAARLADAVHGELEDHEVPPPDE